jgi:hypothetical protein
MTGAALSVKMSIAHPLAYCPTCKIAFPLATGREGGSFVVQNSTTKCPNGHFARILNAHYQSFETEARATLAALGPVTHKAVSALWEKLSRRDASPEQAQAEAERIAAGLGSIFNAASLADPTRKAILEVLFTDFAATTEPDEGPPIATITAPRIPEAEAAQRVQEKRKGGNRAFQRSLRHKQRMLMNPRTR